MCDYILCLPNYIQTGDQKNTGDKGQVSRLELLMNKARFTQRRTVLVF